MLADKPIAKQISRISLMLLGGLLLLLVFAFTTSFSLKSVFNQYRQAAQATTAANLIFEDVFEARTAALQWSLTESAADARAFRENIAELKVAEADLAETGGGIEFSSAFAQLGANIAEFERFFSEMVAARAAYQEVEAALSSAGLDARRALSDIMNAAFSSGNTQAASLAGQAQQALMLGRYYLEKFLLTKEGEFFDRSVSEINEAAERIDAVQAALTDPDLRDTAQSAQSQVAVFAQNKAVVARAVAPYVEAERNKNLIGQKLLTDVEAFTDIAVARQAQLGPRGIAISNWFVVFVCVTAAVIFFAGWHVARKLSLRISRDVEQAAETMSRIADGDLDAPVDGSQAENEVGRIARALEVFKQNGKAAIAAEARKKQAELDRRDAEALHKQQQHAQQEAARAEAEALRQTMIADLTTSVGQVVTAASAGDFSQRVDATFSYAALTSLAEGVNTFVASVEEGLVETGRVMEKVATGDLGERMQGEFRGAFKNLQSNTNEMIASLRTLISDMSGSSANLSGSSSEMQQTAETLSKQAEQNAASLEQTSAALEELTVSIKQVGDNVAEATENARVVSSTAQSSSAVAADAAAAMAQISDASKEIAKVVTVINDNAFQINLLALNAGVEAARAGDAGRGFSVVASEVRQLAQRAGEAAKEIDVVIARSDQAVSDGVAKVTNAQQSLDTISSSVHGVTQRIEEISGAISEQVNGIGEINSAVAQIDSNTQKQAAAFEEVTAASTVLSSEAAALKKSTQHFKTGASVYRLARPKAARPDVSRRAQPRPAAAPFDGALAADLTGWEEFWKARAYT